MEAKGLVMLVNATARPPRPGSRCQAAWGGARKDSAASAATFAGMDELRPPLAGRMLIRELRRQLAAAGDSERARGQQAYMKSAMPFWGVRTPELRKIGRSLFRTYPLDGFEEWRATVLSLWRTAGRREERHAAIDLGGFKAYRPLRTMRALPVFEEMIVSGAWWDYVDAIASRRLRELVERYPKTMAKRMRIWSRCGDLWKRRSSIICQLGRKGDTDLELLYATIGENLVGSRFGHEFFVRKAIGWALRDLAWHDPEKIRRFVREHEDRLSPLSRREALKNLRRAQPVAGAVRRSRARSLGGS